MFKLVQDLLHSKTQKVNHQLQLDHQIATAESWLKQQHYNQALQEFLRVRADLSGQKSKNWPYITYLKGRADLGQAICLYKLGRWQQAQPLLFLALGNSTVSSKDQHLCRHYLASICWQRRN